jgi:hypothetical protein
MQTLLAVAALLAFGLRLLTNPAGLLLLVVVLCCSTSCSAPSPPQRRRGQRSLSVLLLLGVLLWIATTPIGRACIPLIGPAGQELERAAFDVSLLLEARFRPLSPLKVGTG